MHLFWKKHYYNALCTEKLNDLLKACSCSWWSSDTQQCCWPVKVFKKELGAATCTVNGLWGELKLHQGSWDKQEELKQWQGSILWANTKPSKYLWGLQLQNRQGGAAMIAVDWIVSPKLMLLLFSFSVVPDSLWPHGLQHTGLPCPSLSPGVCSNSCPLSRWCHPTYWSSFTLFSSCPQSFPV